MPRRPKTRTAPRREPRQRRSADTVEVLLAATERVLAQHGYQGATTNRIATTAGVSIGTLYHFFPSKEALIEALVHRMWSGELEALEARASVLTEQPLEDAIRLLVGVMVEMVRTRQDLYARWYNEA